MEQGKEGTEPGPTAPLGDAAPSRAGTPSRTESSPGKEARRRNETQASGLSQAEELAKDLGASDAPRLLKFNLKPLAALPIPRKECEPYQEICELYNSDKAAFQDQYGSNYFSVANVDDLRRDLLATPKFQTMDNGIYMIVRTGSSNFAVPRPGIAFSREYHDFGAMGKVFDCKGYNPEMRYKSISLIKPASFQMTGDSWQLTDRGAIELGNGEPDE